MSDVDLVKPNGETLPKRTFGYLNNWCPAITECVCCNNHIKFLSNGKETRQKVWYCTCYATKKQSQSHNTSALLANGVAYHRRITPDVLDARDRNRLLLFRCFQSLNTEMEYSGPQVISHLMGWGDSFQSHNYASLYWSSFASVLVRRFPELKGGIVEGLRRPEVGGATVDARSEARDDVVDERANRNDNGQDEGMERVTLGVDAEGQLTTKSQVLDYRKRGTGMEDMSVLSFVVDTYETDIQVKDRSASGEAADDEDAKPETLDDEDADPTEDGAGPSHPTRRGRKRNMRVHYGAGHPRGDTRQRMVRTKGHKYLPSIVGPYFPKQSDGDLYYSSVLLLLKPWQELEDLKEEGQSWRRAYDDFMQSAGIAIHRIVTNLQYYHECRDMADAEAAVAAGADGEGGVVDSETEMRDVRHGDVGEGSELGEDKDRVEDDEPDEQAVEEMERAEDTTDLYGAAAVQIGRASGVFDDCVRTMERVGVEGSKHSEDTYMGAKPATVEDLDRLARWRAKMDKQVKGRRAGEKVVVVDDVEEGAGIQQVDGGDVGHDEPSVSHMETGDQSGPGAKATPAQDVNDLLPDQRRAFDIIEWHLSETLTGNDVPQLLMQIHGEGGTGKSRVIRAITKLFEDNRHGNMLTRSAYTGIAASIIDGKTLHTIAAIPIRGGLPSASAIQEITLMMKNRLYLIIDEVSMLSREFLAKLSTIMEKISAANGNANADSPFGGLNVIIVGDFHQFPPVACSKQSPLYYPIATRDTDDQKRGRQLYELFMTVVILKEQVRVKDPVWTQFLRDAWHGTCSSEQLAMLRGLILTAPDCPPTEFDTAPWSSAVLVTPRHSVRKAWNREATRKHCGDAKEVLYVCRAKDTIGNRPLTLSERRVVAEQRGKAKRKEGLATTVEFSRGMEVMVTFNVETDLDVANGARGRIVDVVLDKEEEVPAEGARVVNLKHMPAYILVEMQRTKAETLEGLPPGVLPLEPMSKQFSIVVPGVGKKTVKRQQLPLTAAYTFTDMRAQGQTISHMVVDIGKPSTGGLTPFNAYVALSCSSGRDTIRLLRDFEDKLFTTLLLVELEAEDRRVEQLDETTKKWWGELKGHL